MATLTLMGEFVFSSYLIPVTSTLLMFRCVPGTMLGVYGGERVFKWNKVVYGVLTVITIVVIWGLPIMMGQ
jgi:hypothetical protein